jgi:hypothetical protein
MTGGTPANPASLATGVHPLTYEKGPVGGTPANPAALVTRSRTLRP